MFNMFIMFSKLCLSSMFALIYIIKNTNLP